jgi:hypothetical protein
MRRSRCIHCQVRYFHFQFQHLQNHLTTTIPPSNSHPKLPRLHLSNHPANQTPPDLKNTSDDAIPNYLNSLSFKQSHTLGDVRLALGYSAFAICAACFCWDYKLGFEDTKYYSAAAVALYTLLNGALTLWVWLVEGGTVYVGTSKAGDKVSYPFSNPLTFPIPITYTLTLTPTTTPN